MCGGYQIDRCCAQRRRVALRGNIVFECQRHTIQWPARRVIEPTRFGSPGLCERQLGAQQPGGTNVRFPALNVCQNRLGYLDRAERPFSVTLQQGNRGQFIQI